MSTNGSFTPSAAPECAYEPEMTRADALARRTAGTLDPNCVVVITDGPVIGTPGNTSPTTIELQPVTPTDLGRAALVHTTFDNVAFVGNYDIDAGTAGSLNELTDHWGNTISDEDANAPTVHTQWPYHLSGPDLRDNTVDDCVLPGWDTAVGQIRDNDLKGSTVDLTGRTAGRFNSNRILDSNVVLNRPTSFVDDNQVTGAGVSDSGTAGSFSFQLNVVITGDVTVDSASVANVTVNNNVIGGTSGGYTVLVQGKTAGQVILSGNRLFNRGLGAQELLISGTGSFDFVSSEINTGVLTFSGPGIVDVIGANLGGATITSGPGDFVGLRFQMTGSTANHQGSGLMTLQDAALNASNVITAPGSTRGLRLLGATVFGSTVTQNGTGTTSNDSFQAGVTFAQASVALNATAAGTPASTFQGVLVTSGGQLNVADHTDSAPVTSSRIDTSAILNLSGAGTFTNSRLGSSAVLNLTAAATNSVIEGAFTKSPVGVNANRLANPGYDDWVA